ncbi:hypothetical protein O0L34_g3980 [Tuta absoluta]|nr:hypothetical protein O0L34_g3980 [Tuta absoluta]
MSDKSTPEPEPSSSAVSEKPSAKRMDCFKHGKPLNAQARHIVYNVTQYCMQECETFKHTEFKKYFASYRNRTAKATGVSQDTVLRITNFANTEGTVAVPKPHGSSLKYPEADAQFYGLLRDKITEFYTVDLVPDLFHLYKAMEIKMPQHVLAKLLRQMGYVFIKTDVRGIAIVETLRSRLKRIQYLEQLNTARAEERSIVFINQIIIRVLLEEPDSKMTKRAKLKNLKSYGKEVPLVLMQVWNAKADTPSGFLVYSLEDVTENYNGWLRTKLILNVPDNAVIVFSSTLFPNKYVKGYPYSTASTAEMKEWLKSQSIEFNDNFTKPKLYDIILKNIQLIPLDNGENFLTDNGYMVLQMPKYHWGLNPVEVIWPNLFVYLTEKTPLDAENRVLVEINKISPEEWKKAKEFSMKTEQKLIENEAAMDEITDRLSLHFEKHHEAAEDWSSDDEEYRNIFY